MNYVTFFFSTYMWDGSHAVIYAFVSISRLDQFYDAQNKKKNFYI